ncbi:MAG: hypothetical protein E6I80_09060 [Chloroflexi bacterium]|nr:MAG: hypothetical protein E6I80_09060 [Chloroflexota bacterium]
MRQKSAVETRLASLALPVLVLQEHSARYEGAEAMDQQEKDALERLSAQGVSKEHVALNDADDFDVFLLSQIGKVRL